MGKKNKVSDNYENVTSGDSLPDEVSKNAWKDRKIPEAQRKVVNSELKQMYSGKIIPVYSVLSDAIKITGNAHDQVVEVGCASGYYSEVLTHLLGHQIKYIGIDYSIALLKLARFYYPNQNFVIGDASLLPLGSKTVDILISGCVLLHMPNYRQAIFESARVSRKWVIFHRTPINYGQTEFYTKNAYGIKCLEIIFGEEELLNLFKVNGLSVFKSYEIIKSNISKNSKKHYGITYLCKVN